MELAESLIAAAGGAQDQLPLIQHGLMLLHRDHVLRAGLAKGAPWKLTLQTCNRARGLGKLLSDHADEVAGRIANERAVKDMFRALTDINADGHAVRRPQTFRQLVSVTAADENVLRDTVDAFRADGVSFLRPYGDTPLTLDDRVDISHEALIRCWNRIAEPEAGWLIREFKNGLVWRSLLVQAEIFDKNPKNVLSSATTEERALWLKRRNPAWSERYGGGWERVQRLIEASIAERDWLKQEEVRVRQRDEAARIDKIRSQHARERTRVVSIGLVIALVLLVVASWLAVYAMREQRRATAALRQAETETASNAAARQRAEARRQELEQVVADVTTSLNALRIATEAAQADGSLRSEINQAQGNIAQQVAKISTVANPPRIYIQISAESQREVARELALRIEREKVGGESIVVPGVQLKASTVNALRCFRASECEEAARLVGIVNSLLQTPKLSVQDFTQDGAKSNPRPRQYEIWLAPGAIELAGSKAPVATR
jgi:flagellar basal body-associated protein FliL